MLSVNTVKHSNGEILTGKLWRKDHSFFKDLPFYTNIPRLDKLDDALREALREKWYGVLLVKFGKGLDEVHPFCDTFGVDHVLRDAENILSPNSFPVGPRTAARIWGFMSKFVMLDRFSKVLGAAEAHPGLPVPRKICSLDSLGTVGKILDEINPSTKLLQKFLKTWRDRKKTRAQHVQISDKTHNSGAAVALTLSRRLIAGMKIKNILNIEAGLEMMALAMIICSENSGVFPEMAADVKNVLSRISLDQMDMTLFEDISNEIETLHSAMKNLMEVVFAISPLLLLSTRGWSYRSFNSTNLLRIFKALGNNRPQILVELEDCILLAIIGLSEGKSTEDVLDSLYSQIQLLEKTLENDEDALFWFNFSPPIRSTPSTPPLSERPSAPLAAVDVIAVESKKSSSDSLDNEEEGKMSGVGSKKPSLDLTEDEERGEKMVAVESKELSSDSFREVDAVVPSSDSSSDEEKMDSMDVDEEKQPTLATTMTSAYANNDAGLKLLPLDAMDVDEFCMKSSVHFEAPFEPRRSSRNAAQKYNPSLQLVKPPKSTRKVVSSTDPILVEDNFGDHLRKLSDVGKATYHPTLYADIVGWGSTVDAGAKPYRYVPVQIVTPGDVASTGSDIETLRKVEALIQAEFKDGLPPHLLPNAQSLEYTSRSDHSPNAQSLKDKPAPQSRIFVASHSDFANLHARDIQRILRERLILVHGNPLDYKYGWDLESFGQVYDVDKKISVHVCSFVDPLHQATLRQFHEITTTLSSEDCPPINAISLPASHQNLYIPCQFRSLASHEVAQSRVPSHYETQFQTSKIKSEMEWSLIGGKGAVSPFHLNSDGFGTVVTVLEGSKYWIVATRFGEYDNVCSVDSLGPTWEPYFINEGDNGNRFRFEAVHLQKGDMLVMPGGVPHWVLGTSNAICVGRHFYSSSSIRLSVVSIVHSFLLKTAITNDDHLESRSLLYQMMVFWSMRHDKTDVDGAHIPDLSSEDGFFDIIYLGIFIILSPAFDMRFYNKKPPPNLVEEMAHAVRHFHSLLHIFSQRFFILVGGEFVVYSYVVDRMLGEFAAASVVFANAMDDSHGDGKDYSFTGQIEDILQASYSSVFPFYRHCLDRFHKHFLWTGPKVDILPRSDAIVPLTTDGELVDHPSQEIYTLPLDATPPTTIPPTGKRHDRGDSIDDANEQRKKRRA